MARSPTEGKVQQHIDRTRNALQDEDLSIAVKWILQHGGSVVKPQELIADEDWSIQATSLYADAQRTDRRFRTNYCSQLDTIGQEAKRLADSYQVRQATGLVLVLYSVSSADSLRNVGFRARTMVYDTPNQDRLVFVVEPTAKQREMLLERKGYVDTKVEEILRENPRLVISPLFPRVYITSGYDTITKLIQSDPLLEPEGITINKRLQERARITGATPLSFLGFADNEVEQRLWGQHKLPHIPAYSKEMIQVVKRILNIDYQPRFG